MFAIPGPVFRFHPGPQSHPFTLTGSIATACQPAGSWSGNTAILQAKPGLHVPHPPCGISSYSALPYPSSPRSLLLSAKPFGGSWKAVLSYTRPPRGNHEFATFKLAAQKRNHADFAGFCCFGQVTMTCRIVTPCHWMKWGTLYLVISVCGRKQVKKAVKLPVYPLVRQTWATWPTAVRQ